MKFKNPLKSATDRLLSEEAENSLYEKAANDIENEMIEKGIWTKAFAQASGDEVKQKAIYIELIVQHYKNQLEAGEELANILATEEEKRKKREARQAAEAAEYNKNRPKTDSEIAEEIRKDREAFIKEQTERDRKLRE
tara:strand:+ start:44 stop:457 length:414 start_codon:yes stop_codon:yes gene_type:complete